MVALTSSSVATVASGKTLEKLNAMNVMSIQDLMHVDRETKCKGVNISALQEKARYMFHIPVELSKHSWMGHFSHAYTDAFKILRVELLELLVYPTKVSIRARTLQRKRIVMLSPFTTVNLHFYWLANDVVSEDESDSEEQQTVEFSSLPPLRIEQSDAFATLTLHDRKMLKDSIYETNRLIRFQNHVRELIDVSPFIEHLEQNALRDESTAKLA